MHREEPTKRDVTDRKAEITPQRYATLRELFLKVLDRSHIEQQKILARDAREDSELRDQVEQLVAIDRAFTGSWSQLTSRN